jgi:hypothetical protein
MVPSPSQNLHWLRDDREARVRRGMSPPVKALEAGARFSPFDKSVEYETRSVDLKAACVGAR